MDRFILASKNRGKVKEIAEILKDFPFQVITMEDAGVHEDVVEDGNTFEENALKKAKEVFQKTGDMTMADDSGIEVDFLNGAPGIYSARFAGENATDEERNQKLLNMLKDVPFEKRQARFVCVIAVVLNEKDYFTVRGTCEGFLANEPVGENGFGYDPLFFMPEYNLTTAQMDSSQKHQVSHRGKALRLMVSELEKRFEKI